MLVFLFGGRASSDTDRFLRSDGGDVGALDFSSCFGIGGGFEEGVLLRFLLVMRGVERKGVGCTSWSSKSWPGLTVWYSTILMILYTPYASSVPMTGPNQ